MKRVLLTGATGFVGRTAARIMSEHGYDVAVAVRNVHKARCLFGTDSSMTVIDTLDPGFASEIASFDPDAVVHLAAYFNSDPDPAGVDELMDSNLRFTVRLLEALRHTHCRLVVSAGTFSECFECRLGHPVAQNLYSATKSAERPIMRYYSATEGWKWVNLIIYTPYGRFNPTKKVIDYMVQALDAPSPVAFSPGRQVLDFIHVDDIGGLLCRILERAGYLADEEEFHVGTGTGHTLIQVAEAMESVFGGKLNALWGGRPYRAREIMHAVAPVRHMCHVLDWQPHITLEQGLRIFRDDLDNLFSDTDQNCRI